LAEAKRLKQCITIKAKQKKKKKNQQIQPTPKAQLSLFADETMFFITDRNSKRVAIQLQHQINLAFS
jgi:hypothetical protein